MKIIFIQISLNKVMVITQRNKSEFSQFFLKLIRHIHNYLKFVIEPSFIHIENYNNLF